MKSFRRFASSKFLAASSKNLLSLAQPSILGTARATALFSSEVDKARKKVAKALNKEVDYERDNYAVDETAQSFIDENGYTLIEDNSINIALKKESSGFQVEISFQARYPEETNPEEEGFEEDQDEEAAQDPMGNYVDFQVYITSPEGRTTVWECLSIDSDLNIQSAFSVEDLNTYKTMSRFQRNEELYTGPYFNTLDERLQSAMMDYLKSFGINEELCIFVEHYSQDKDQRLYMDWLENVKNFVDN